MDTAADLAALGAAAHLARGETSGAACGVAAAVVDTPAGSDAGPDRSLVDCQVTGPAVTVTVSAAVRVLGVRGTVTGRARAGPVP